MPPKKHPPLTPEQAALVENHQRQLHQILRGDKHVMYARIFYDSYDDMFQVGNLGMCIAASRFDPERGIKFITYAWHYIRQRVCAYAVGSCAGTMVASKPNGKNTRRQWLNKTSMISPTDGFDTLEFLMGRDDPAFERIEMSDTMRKVRACCTRQEFMILCARASGYTLREIAPSMGITRERVRQIEYKANKKLRKRLSAMNRGHRE